MQFLSLLKLLIRLLAVSLFIVREQMWIEKNAFSQLGLGQVKKKTYFSSSLGFCTHFLLLAASLLAACACYPGNFEKKRLLTENDT